MDKKNKITKIINECKESWNIPGIAVAVLKDGEVFYKNCVGYRDVENKLELNCDTIMPIASSTKPFASSLTAMLVDEGKVDWDQPIRNYVPEFYLKDEYAANHATPRDLLCHRTGLPRHDLMMYNTEMPLEELVNRIKYLEPNKEFRQCMQYQNQMFMTIGYLIEKVTGKKWTEIVKEKIFDSLDMSRSNCTINDTLRDDNYSKAYNKDEEGIKEIPLANCDAAGTAGTINSTLNDMIKWLLLHLNNGQFKGKQIISNKNIKETHTPQVVMNGFKPFGSGEVDFESYCLAWFAESYRGYRHLHHGGTIDGFQINVSFMPKENLGVIVFTNLNRNWAFEAINYAIYDIMLDLEEIDWNKRLLDIYEEMMAAMSANTGDSEELSDNQIETKSMPLTHQLEAYTGIYEDSGYGRLEIKLEINQLVMYYNNFILPMTHNTYNSFTIKDNVLNFETFAKFNLDIQGKINSVDVGFAVLDDGFGKVTFKRV